MKKIKLLKNSVIINGGSALLLLMMLTMPGSMHSQNASTYTFTQSMGVYSPINGTVVNLIPNTNLQGVLQLNYSLINFGFPFVYAGNTFSSIGACANGYCTLGNISHGKTNPLNDEAYALSMLGCSLGNNNPNSDIEYKVTGITPNRVLTIQYKNFGNTTYHYNFQLKLYETSNKIKMIYGNCDTIPYLLNPEVGINGNTMIIQGLSATSLDFNTRKTITNWGTSERGTTTISTMGYYSFIKPASGLTYTWTPPSICVGTPSAGSITSTANPVCGIYFTLSLQGASYPITYQWMSSTDNINWTSIAGAAGTRYYYSAQITTDTYYKCRVTANNGGLSSYSPVFLERMATQAEACGNVIIPVAGMGVRPDNSKNMILYPNPADNLVNIDIASEKEEVLKMEVFDVAGIKVLEKYVTVTIGNNTVNASLEGKVNGIYFIRMMNRDNEQVFRETIIKE